MWMHTTSCSSSRSTAAAQLVHRRRGRVRLDPVHHRLRGGLLLGSRASRADAPPTDALRRRQMRGRQMHHRQLRRQQLHRQMLLRHVHALLAFCWPVTVGCVPMSVAVAYSIAFNTCIAS